MCSLKSLSIYHISELASIRQRRYLDPYFSGHECHVNSLITRLIDRRLRLDLQSHSQNPHNPTMSDTEPVKILGVISSVISIVNGTKKVYDAATSAEDLPEVFRQVASQLPIISNILSTHLDKAERYIKDGRVSRDAYEGVKKDIYACKNVAKELDDMFRKVIPGDIPGDIPGENASRMERYIAAVKTAGKGNTAEKLMKAMLEKLQLFAGKMRIGTKDEVEQITKAIKEVSDIPLSIPENELQEHSFKAYYSGSGTQYNAQGEYIAQGNARQYNSGGAPMYFGKD